MKLILGWAGKAKHGKTESVLAVKRYCDANGITCGIYEFSAVILRWCIEQGRLPEGTQRPNMDKAQLQVLVDAGNEGRRISQDFWVGQILAAMKADANDVSLTPNIRFAHEVDMLHAVQGARGYVVRNTRLNADGSVFISPDRDPNDVTETALDHAPVDFYITTKTGQEELATQTAVLIFKYLWGE